MVDFLSPPANEATAAEDPTTTASRNSLESPRIGGAPPPVSIGLPVYNGENYLRGAIESLLGQTFGDFELIISDNGSTDSTEEICRNYATLDRRIRYLRQSVNVGAAGNYDLTFHAARGEFFKWHAHDDLCAPGYLARCLELLREDRTVSLAHTNSALIDGRRQFVSELLPGEYDPKNVNDRRRDPTASQPHVRYLDVLLHTVWAYEIYGVARTSLMRRTGLHRPFSCAEKVFIAELSLLGKYVEAPEQLFFCRRHAAQASWITTDAATREFLAPQSAKGPAMPRHVRAILAHSRAIARLPIPFGEKVRCYGALAKYALQWKRLMRGIRHALRGAGPAGDTKGPEESGSPLCTQATQASSPSCSPSQS